MNNKKTQQEIIVTVILVLVAIAAVALIATFIMNQVREGSNSASAKAQCLKLNDFSIETATNSAADNVVLFRSSDDGVVIKEVKFYVNDVSKENSTELPNALEKKSYTVAGVNAGDTVKAYFVLNSTGILCDIPVSKVAVAA